VSLRPELRACLPCQRPTPHSARHGCLACRKKAKALRAPKPERKSRPRKKRKGSKAAMAREADRLWSLIVRSRGACEADGPHNGALQGAHGFSRRYRNTRWLPINGFCLCAGHHLRWTYDSLGWTDYLITAWGAPVYEELKRLAQKTTPPDVEAALAKLREEAASRGLFFGSSSAKSAKEKPHSNNDFGGMDQ
jgi:hypothetical protein